MYLTPFIGMCFPYKWCQGTPVVHSSYPGTDDPLHCMFTAMAEVFRVHLSIISIGVNSKGNLQISCKCFAFVDLLFMLPCHQPLSTYSAVQRQLFNVVVHSACNITYVHVRNDHNTHRLFIKYTWVFSGDRKFVDRSGSSLLFLACL